VARNLSNCVWACGVFKYAPRQLPALLQARRAARRGQRSACCVPGAPGARERKEKALSARGLWRNQACQVEAYFSQLGLREAGEPQRAGA